ncbi:hypothetical protein ACFLT9_12870 [Acidobacteriota bacterium]
MEREILLKRLNELGYPLFEIDDSINNNEILEEVVKSHELRFWEGFPILLARLLDKDQFTYEEICSSLDSREHKGNFHFLLTVSFALYSYLGLRYSPPQNLIKKGYIDQDKFNIYVKNFKGTSDITEAENRLSTSRLINTFRNYYTQSEWNMKNYVELKDDFDLEYAMSQIFSKKQRELFLKKLKGEKMTKTEKEYYSRSVKKKVIALANPDLHKLATRLIKG